jgi:hypothetical protein
MWPNGRTNSSNAAAGVVANVAPVKRKRTVARLGAMKSAGAAELLQNRARGVVEGRVAIGDRSQKLRKTEDRLLERAGEVVARVKLRNAGVAGLLPSNMDQRNLRSGHSSAM